MLSQEVIYQHLSQGKYSEIIELLYQNGNSLDKDPGLAFAISIFMAEFFKYMASSDSDSVANYNDDLDILFISHTRNKYRLNDQQAIQLIHLLYPRVPIQHLYKGASDYPADPICNEIILKYKNISEKALKNCQEFTESQTFSESLGGQQSGQKFDTEIRSMDGNYWVKVFLRSDEFLDIIATHIAKLHAVGTVNITKQQNGKNNLTVYGQRPYAIEETRDEIILTLDNYFSRSPADPIFKENVLSGISDIAYYQIVDYMLKLGTGLEGYRNLSIKMDEERYRDYFVNYLDSLSNNHTATGETFHGSGKTDILIRNQSKEVLLVAECKLWNGKSHFLKAVDQLFERYVIWRDGKIALLVFNTKTAGFTNVIETAVETLKTHRLYVSFNGKRKETSFSFTFRNHNDHAKLVKLELVLFNFV